MTNWKQFITEEVLRECWDADKRPGEDLPNRTFDNRNDMIDLYEAIFKGGKDRWAVFTVYSNDIWWQNGGGLYDTVEQEMPDFNAWLFCLGNEDYEGRCKLVAKLYGYKEE